MRKLISTGSPMEKAAGYSRAVVQDDFCFVAGTTGYDYESMHMPRSVEEQTRNALATIEKSLQEAGFVRPSAFLQPFSFDPQQIFQTKGKKVL